MPVDKQQIDKQEREMVQIELYTENLDAYADMFFNALNFTLIEKKPGWRQLRHPAYFDIMLFSPSNNTFEETQWALPESGEGGKGIEVVICVSELTNIRNEIMDRGYECSDIRHPPWGGVEFFFKLQEGYLFRIKQPRAFTHPAGAM